MADPYDAANVPNDPLRSSGDDNYQNLGGLPYVNMDPNAPPGGNFGAVAPPPPPPGQPQFQQQQQIPPLHQTTPTDNGVDSGKPPVGEMVGDGVQELPDSDPSESKKHRIDKPKVKKLKNKIKRVKIIYWAMIVVWTLFLILFVLIHLNQFGIHMLPFLQKE
ncbi:hypothetical protein CRE_03922 [Caenorhabditis remanei]|uniref:Uncharacterized protein n=1 Tax=Caenorhabditis remanei TaxID=31234 RepID=E3LXV2_CAERE|nr:hypothetical protein CRE_03922 [Caenorhabditis remanei]